MSNAVLIIGESGTGKSTAIRNLDPKTTFIINILDKPLPFRGYKSSYKPISGWSDKEGNYFFSDDWQRIIRCIQMVDKERPEITTLILDDAQYLMANEYMRRAKEVGYAKFVELAQHVWTVINTLNSCRSDLFTFVLSHNETDQNGKSKCKTIGKMLDEKITLEGMFTIVFHSLVMDKQYKFLTQNDGYHVAKSPLGMFSTEMIDNDLLPIIEIMKSYMNEDIKI